MKKQNDQSFCGGPIFNITTNLLSDPIVFKKFNLMQIADTFLDTGGEIYPHRQVCTELSYIISGKGTFVSDEKKFEVSEGDVHIIPSGSMLKRLSRCERAKSISAREGSVQAGISAVFSAICCGTPVSRAYEL